MRQHDIAYRIREFIQHDLIKSADQLTLDEPLISSGLLDSFALANLAVFIETEWNVELLDSELTVDRMDTLNLMAGMVSERMDQGDSGKNDQD